MPADLFLFFPLSLFPVYFVMRTKMKGVKEERRRKGGKKEEKRRKKGKEGGEGKNEEKWKWKMGIMAIGRSKTALYVYRETVSLLRAKIEFLYFHLSLIVI